MPGFPYLPMAAIMASLVTDMVLRMNVVAYAGFMVEYLGVVDDKDKAGYNAGLLCASFMIGRTVSSHFWGMVSDRYGCRFVMAFGLSATAVLSVAFGCSPTFAWAVALRFLLGLVNGTLLAGKTIVSDVCGKEHDTVGMGVVSDADGGSRVPSWMQSELTSPVVGTHKGPGYDTENLEHDTRDPMQKSLLWQQHIRIIVVIDALYAITYAGLENVFTLWALSSMAKGGLHWSVLEIGQVFFACGVMLLAFELCAVPIITPRLGVRFCQRLGSVVEVPLYIAIPLLSRMGNTGLPAQVIAAVLLFTFLACSNQVDAVGECFAGLLVVLRFGGEYLLVF
eukprot:jgi/Undpi1/10517/HiC_scaffold_29.g12967.m1